MHLCAEDHFKYKCPSHTVSHISFKQTKKNAAIQHVSVALAEQLDKTCMHMMQVNNCSVDSIVFFLAHN